MYCQPSAFIGHTTPAAMRRVWSRHDLDSGDERWITLLSGGSAVYMFDFRSDWATRVHSHVKRYGFGRAGLKARCETDGFFDEAAVVVASRRPTEGLMVSTVSVKNALRFEPPPLESPDSFFERGAFRLGDVVLLGVDNVPPRIPIDGALPSVLMPGAEWELACAAAKSAKALNVYCELNDDEVGRWTREALLSGGSAVEIGGVVRVVDSASGEFHRRKPDRPKRKRASNRTLQIKTTRSIGEGLKPKQKKVRIVPADRPPCLWEAVGPADRLRALTGMNWSEEGFKHAEQLRKAGHADRVEGGSGSLWVDVVSISVRDFLRGPDWLQGEDGCPELFRVLSKASRPGGPKSPANAGFPNCLQNVRSFVQPSKAGARLVVDAGTLGADFFDAVWLRFQQTAKRRAETLSDWAENSVTGTRAFTAEERRLLRCASKRSEAAVQIELNEELLPPCVRSLLPGGAARKKAEAGDPEWDHMRNEERMVAGVVLGSITPRPPVVDIEDMLGACFSNIKTSADKASFRYHYNRPMPTKMFSCGRLIASAGFSLCPYAKVYGSNGAFIECTKGCDTSRLRRTPFGAAVARQRAKLRDD